MPSVLTYAVITSCEHQLVSTVCACMAKQRSQNFCVKNQPFFISSTCENRPYSYVVVMNVSFCQCAAQLKLVHNCPESVKNNATLHHNTANGRKN